MIYLRLLLLLFISLFEIDLPAQAAPKVVASIKPIHSLVAAVMQNVGEPKLLMDVNSSPHQTSLKPSQARLLQEADLVFWVGPELETFLGKSLAALSSGRASRTLLDLTNLQFPVGEFKSRDAHIWLDPQNAITIAQEVAKILGEVDEQNKQQYLSNAEALSKKIILQQNKIMTNLAPYQSIPFLSFHDAYGHFENRFGLKEGAALTVTPETKPGAARIAQFTKLVVRKNIRCMFSEPQFNPKLLRILSKATSAKIIRIDPIGISISKGPGQYFSLMRELSSAVVHCLGFK